jgi:hypothetical protein
MHSHLCMLLGLAPPVLWWLTSLGCVAPAQEQPSCVAVGQAAWNNSQSFERRGKGSEWLWVKTKGPGTVSETMLFVSTRHQDL